jgi:amicyanin
MKKIIVLSSLVLFMAAGCNNSTVAQPTPAPSPVPTQSPTPAPTPNPSPVSAPTSHSMTITGFAFSSPSLTIKKGDTVIWTNQDSVSHTVTGDDGGPASPSLAKGQSYSYTFNTAGTYSYHCAVHPNMKGTVAVQ